MSLPPRSRERGLADPLSLLAVVFLTISLIGVTSVVNNSNLVFDLRKKAAEISDELEEANFLKKKLGLSEKQTEKVKRELSQKPTPTKPETKPQISNELEEAEERFLEEAPKPPAPQPTPFCARTCLGNFVCQPDLSGGTCVKEELAEVLPPAAPVQPPAPSPAPSSTPAPQPESPVLDERGKGVGEKCNANLECESGNCQAAPGGKFCVASGQTVSAKAIISPPQPVPPAQPPATALTNLADNQVCTAASQCKSGNCEPVGYGYSVCKPVLTAEEKQKQQEENLIATGRFLNAITFGTFGNYAATYADINAQNPEATYLQNAFNPQGLQASAALGTVLTAEAALVYSGGSIISSLATTGGFAVPPVSTTIIPALNTASTALYSYATAALATSPTLQTTLAVATLAQGPIAIAICNEQGYGSLACQYAIGGLTSEYFTDPIGTVEALAASGQIISQSASNAIDIATEPIFQGLTGLDNPSLGYGPQTSLAYPTTYELRVNQIAQHYLDRSGLTGLDPSQGFPFTRYPGEFSELQAEILRTLRTRNPSIVSQNLQELIGAIKQSGYVYQISPKLGPLVRGQHDPANRTISVLQNLDRYQALLASAHEFGHLEDHRALGLMLAAGHQFTPSEISLATEARQYVFNATAFKAIGDQERAKIHFAVALRLMGHEDYLGLGEAMANLPFEWMIPRGADITFDSLLQEAITLDTEILP